jgi:hypothetical protein
MFKTENLLVAAVRKTVNQVTITDIHTHLFPPSHGSLLFWGPDDLLTYHYLVAELFSFAPPGLTPAAFYALPKPRQADLVWEYVFLKHAPLSEAARGVLTVLDKLGLSTARRDLRPIRRWFARQNVNKYMEKVFELAGVDYAVMTNDPLVAEEAACLARPLPVPSCLKPALRADGLLGDWPGAVAAMNRAGYQVRPEADKVSLGEVRRFLLDWCEKLQPLYLAASLPPEFAYPDDSLAGRLMEQAILPAARESGLPLAMMIGVRRRVNPPMGWAGDAMGLADLSSVMRLCQANPKQKFLLTVLARANQQELAVLARKFNNLHIFGCWWFCNIPSVIAEITAQRLELLGTAFTAQHSDARILDQLIYKWAHSREVIGGVLADKYAAIFRAGWRPTAAELQRDVRALLGGSFEEFLRR